MGFDYDHGEPLQTNGSLNENGSNTWDFATGRRKHYFKRIAKWNQNSADIAENE